MNRPLGSGLGAKLLALSLIAGFSTLCVPLVHACTEYAASRVTERTASDVQSHQDMFTVDQDLRATGDFDGDGRLDEAFFSQKDGRYSLIVCLEDGQPSIKIWDLSGIGGHGIRKAPPGVYQAACALGYGPPCRPDEISELELGHDAIEYFNYEKPLDSIAGVTDGSRSST